MKHTSSQLKAISRKALDGNWGLPIASNLILGVIGFIIMFFVTFFHKHNNHYRYDNQ